MSVFRIFMPINYKLRFREGLAKNLCFLRLRTDRSAQNWIIKKTTIAMIDAQDDYNDYSVTMKTTMITRV